MTIKTKISFKEYSKLLFGLAYGRPIMKVLIGIAIAIIIWIIGYYINFLPVSKPAIYPFLTLVLITVIQPTIIYWTISRNYASSNHLAEQLDIEVTGNEIKVRGDSFYTELTWKKIFKVDEVIGFFLIYQNNLSAIIVSKSLMTDAEILEFRGILEKIPDLPIRIKDTQR